MPISQSATEFFLDRGDILYREGDEVDCGYIIASGELVLYSEQAGERKTYERRGAGSIIGELSILTGKRRAVTVEAIEPCLIYRISANQILHRYDKLDPLLRACVETSIAFVCRANTEVSQTDDTPLVPGTLRNANALIERFKIEQDILSGLHNQEFSLAYQPIIDLEDGQMLGFESLMRWQHPVVGNIPPIKFIEIAESMGAICKLTDFALMESCAALKRFRQLTDCRDDFFASINVSGEDIGRPEFFDFLVHVLDLNNLEPHHVKLEVTETTLVLKSKQVLTTLERLRNFGIGISIDDFGTGYSNLAYLKELPLTALKIDRAFAGDAFNNPISFSIVKMIVQLGHELGVRVIAEGLETAEDVKTLRDIGCDLAQGYYFSKPVSEMALTEMIDPSYSGKIKVA